MNAAYVCSIKHLVLLASVLTSTASLAKTNQKPNCIGTILTPPQHTDSKVSDSLANEFQSVYTRRGKTCPTIVSFSTSRNTLAKYGVTETKTVSIESLTKEQWEQLRQSLGASHVVFFKTVESKKELEYHVYSLETMVSVERGKLSGIRSFEKAKRSGIGKFFAESVHFVPNSIAYSPIKFSDPVTEPLEGITYKEDKEVEGWLPGYLTAWTLTNTDHPYQHGDLEIGANFSPLIAFSAFNRTSKVEKLTQGTKEDVTYNYKMYFLLATGNGSINFHTPSGAFSFSLGIGPGYLGFTDERGTNKDFVTVFTSGGFSWTAFFDESLFIQLSASSYAATDQVKTPFLKSGQWSDGRLSIGYCFPGLKYTVRDLF